MTVQVNPDDSQPETDAARLRFAIARQRLQILRRIERGLETPMALLGIAWLGLLVLELVRGLDSRGQLMVLVIWAIFVLDFLLRLVLAPRKWHFLRRHWLTLLALLLPALRLFRVVRLLRVLARLRGLQLLRLLSSINRGMRALGSTMRRSGFGYVLALTIAVVITGAAGMLFFERQAAPAGSGLQDFQTALWWTAMIITTMGSEYWPRTAEGRALCLLLAIYAFAVFGYVTAAIASLLIGQRERPGQAAVAAAEPDSLHEEIVALRAEVHRLAFLVGQQHTSGRQ